jgi:hypothetical protein
MDEGAGPTAADSGPDGSDLTLSGASWVADGHAGSALHFNGTSASADAASLHVTDLTVTAWVRGDPDHRPAEGAAIVELGGRAGCGHATWGLYVAGAGFAFGWQDATTGQFVQPETWPVEGHDLWDGEWHLISVATWSTNYAYLYTAIDQFAFGNTQAQPDYDYDGLALDRITVGGRAGNCETPPDFRGDVDDLRIYDKMLTGDEIGGQMAPITTTTAITGPATRLAMETMCYEATTTPSPGGGWLSLEIKPNRGSVTSYPMTFENLGVAQQCTSVPAGDYEVRSVYHAMRPWLTSTSDAIALHVAKRSANTTVSGDSQQLTSQPFRVGVAVDGHGVVPTGTVDLYELVGEDRVFRGSYPLTYAGFDFRAGATAELPSRSAGTYSFEAEYAGDTNHEAAAIASGDITVTQDVAAEPVRINDGAAATANPAVSVSIAATGATRVVISMDGFQWKVFDPYQPTVEGWSLVEPLYGGSDIDGIKTVHVRWYNTFNDASAEATASIVLDRTPPTAASPKTSLTAGSSMSAGRVPVGFAWSGSAAPSGMDHYVWSVQTDGGAWSSPVAVTGSSVTRPLASGHTYRFRVQPVDKAGNTGAWSYGSTFKLTGVSQSSSAVHYLGRWSSSTSTSTWWGGTAKSSSTKGATVSYRFTGRSIAWIGLKATTRGKANVYINGVLKATVNLYSATTRKQVVVWSVNYATSATRTITIKVLGTSGRPRVDIDGFIVGS